MPTDRACGESPCQGSRRPGAGAPLGQRPRRGFGRWAVGWERRCLAHSTGLPRLPVWKLPAGPSRGPVRTRGLACSRQQDSRPRDPQVWTAPGPPRLVRQPQAHGHGGAFGQRLPKVRRRGSGPYPAVKHLWGGVLPALRRGRQGEDGPLVRRTRGRAQLCPFHPFCADFPQVCWDSSQVPPWDRCPPGTGVPSRTGAPPETGAPPGQVPTGTGAPRDRCPLLGRTLALAAAGLCPR